jgi:hypothetical protein
MTEGEKNLREWAAYCKSHDCERAVVDASDLYATVALIDSLRDSLARAEQDGKRLTDAVKWALGEEGDFPPPPDDMLDAIWAGRKKLIEGGALVSKWNRWYWWRSALREKAFGESADV